MMSNTCENARQLQEWRAVGFQNGASPRACAAAAARKQQQTTNRPTARVNFSTHQSSTPILLPRTQPFWLEVRSSARLDPTEAGRAAAPDASPTPRRPPCRIRRKLKTIPSRWQFGQMGRAEGSSGSPRRGCIRTRTARGGAMLAVVRRCANRILYAEITDEEFGIGATGTASSMDLVSS